MKNKIKRGKYMDILLLVIYIAIFVIQIILLVKSIKKKEKKYWIRVFVLEIISILVSIILYKYYENLPGYGFMPGLSYFGEILFSMGAIFLYGIMLCITSLIKIITFEKEQKILGKKHKNPIILIFATMLIFLSIILLYKDIEENLKKEETIGTVVAFNEYRSGGGPEYWPVIRFYVDGAKYEDDYPIDDTQIGDKIEIYYYPVGNGKYRITTYYTNYKIIYIPVFIIGVLIIIIRFRNDIFKHKKEPNKNNKANNTEINKEIKKN